MRWSWVIATSNSLFSDDYAVNGHALHDFRGWHDDVYEHRANVDDWHDVNARVLHDVHVFVLNVSHDCCERHARGALRGERVRVRHDDEHGHGRASCALPLAKKSPQAQITPLPRHLPDASESV